MTQFLKKQAAGFYLSALSILLAAVSAIACVVLAQDGENTPALIYLLTAAGVVLTLAAAAFSRTRTGLAVYNTSPAAAAVLYALCLAVLLLGRLEWLGGLMAHNANFAPHAYRLLRDHSPVCGHHADQHRGQLLQAGPGLIP